MNNKWIDNMRNHWNVSKLIAVMGSIATISAAIVTISAGDLEASTFIVSVIIIATLAIGIGLGIFMVRPPSSHVDIEKAIDNLRTQIDVVRTEQNLELILQLTIENTIDNHVATMVRGIHSYKVKNNTKKPIKIPINYNVELGKLQKGIKNAFVSVQIGEVVYEGEKLENCLIRGNPDSTMAYFSFSKKKVKTKTIQPNEALDFKFETIGLYRPIDHLTWTFQDFCEDAFDVQVTNNVNPENEELVFRINDHKDNYEPPGEFKDDSTQAIHFKESLLPYRGFVMSWDFSKEVKVVELASLGKDKSEMAGFT